jgi:predicted transcriptional regulator of viral defense system
MANYVNWVVVARALRTRGLQVVTPLELQQVLGVSAVAARFLVHRYAKRGLLVKLRKGLYGVADRPPAELVVANRLYGPSYLSFEWALSYHHLIPETVYTITSATPRPTRVFAALGKTFEYHRVKSSAFTGYEPVTIGPDTVLLATPEKALVDTLYFVDLKRRSLNDRLNLRVLRWRRAEAYARLFARPSLLRLLKAIR